MKGDKWKARTKRDLMIEVWEALDCESVGAVELEAIEAALREKFGDGAVESHASVARILADEGAKLRHPEVLELDVRQRSTDPYQEIFRDVLKYANFHEAASSIRSLETLRNRFEGEQNRTGLRRVRELALTGKKRVEIMAGNKSIDEEERGQKAEIAKWFAIWLKQPEIFDDWLELRCRSEGFRQKFGDGFHEDLSKLA